AQAKRFNATSNDLQSLDSSWKSASSSSRTPSASWELKSTPTHPEFVKELENCEMSTPYDGLDPFSSKHFKFNEHLYDFRVSGSSCPADYNMTFMIKQPN